MSNASRRYVPQSLWVLGWFCLVVAALHWHNPHFWRTAHEVYERAQAAKAAGNLEAASSLMKNVLAQEKDNLGYLLFDAYVKLDLGRYLQARESFAHAVSLAPDQAETYLGMASLHLKEGNCHSALDQLDLARPHTANSHGHRRLAGLYAQCGDFQAALAVLKTLWVAPPAAAADLEQLLDVAAAAQDWAYIRDLPLTPLLTSDEAEIRTHASDTRAMALRQLGDAAAAYALYRQVPHDGNLVARAQLAQALGHYAGAADLWAQLVARDPELVAWRRSEALSLLKAGQLTRAEECYQALVVDANASQADRVQLAWLLNSQKRYREAWAVLAPLPRPHKELPVLEVQARTAFWAGEMTAAVPLIRALLIRKEAG